MRVRDTGMAKVGWTETSAALESGDAMSGTWSMARAVGGPVRPSACTRTVPVNAAFAADLYV